MRQAFEGVIHDELPIEWDELTKGNFLLNRDFLEVVKVSSNMPFRAVTHQKYCCVEYPIKLNLLSFAKRAKLHVGITIIGAPVSIGKKGYVGDIGALIADYKKRKGIFLVLNDDAPLHAGNNRSGNTLPSFVLENDFADMDDYIQKLRSSYRRRVLLARKKAGSLSVKKIDSGSYTEQMHGLYMKVLNASKYPLETLNSSFFKLAGGDLYCFFNGQEPLAFVLVKGIEDTLYFIFGGMDYSKRDEYDLYFNMLLLVLELGITGSFKRIDFGQTAEQSKQRIGAIQSSRYMHIAAGNKFVDFTLTRLFRFFDYKLPNEKLNVFKQ
ncbi:MAG: hypothetical protein FWG10_11585 [Eubacteriaceae bacterium]|nr:hypothetical protein [Eubacteriaceae bacterium]